MTEEQKKKISDSMNKHWKTPEGKAQKEMLSNLHKGRVRSEETLQKAKEAMLKWYETPEGKAHKEKLSKLKKGCNLTEEHKKKCSEGQLAAYQGEAGEKRKAKLSALKKGVKLSDEHRANLSKAKQGSKSFMWQPFKVTAFFPNGDTEEHIFDGEKPFDDCVTKLGLVNFMRKLKSGSNVILQRRGKKNNWPKQTVVQLKLIKKTNKRK